LGRPPTIIAHVLVAVKNQKLAKLSYFSQAVEKILLEDGPVADIERVRASAKTLDGGTTLPWRENKAPSPHPDQIFALSNIQTGPN
jgi:hypothetical protein